MRAAIWAAAFLVAACGESKGGSVLDLLGTTSGATTTGSGSGGAGGLDLTSTGAGAAGQGSGGGQDCTGLLHATVRDFSASHPDFEDYSGSAAYTGIVEDTLGPDGKPVYAHSGATPQTTGPNEFAEWYRDVDGVNMAFSISLQLTDMDGSFVYENAAFFPVDDQGFGNEGNEHNFHFTTELHASFHYEGGEQFTFTGDDDLWLFINEKLAIDLGGLHPELSQTIDLDQLAPQLGIEVGNVYPMDIFHAERHTTASNFRIETTIGCFSPTPE